MSHERGRRHLWRSGKIPLEHPLSFPFLGLYVHGPYDVNILDVITFYRSVIQLLFTGQCHLVSDARKVCPFPKRADVQVKIDVSGGIRDIFHPVSLRME